MGAAERVGFTYEDGLMGEDIIQEYEALAQNNIGLMITQSLVISPEDAVACGFPVPGIYKPGHVTPLKGTSKNLGLLAQREILPQIKGENRRNTLCISRFSQRRYAAKEPL